jgi:hypothetical protein
MSREKEAFFVSENDVVDWLWAKLAEEQKYDQTMGAMEKRISARLLEVQRQVLERLVQASADNEIFGCPRCGRMLKVEAHHRPRKVDSLFGEISYGRSYGWCEHCQQYIYPADVSLGLHPHAKASPRIQEICAMVALQGPVRQGDEDVRRLSGVDIAASTLHREARRQGERALQLREETARLTEQPKGVAQLAAQAPRLPPHSTLIIEIDAWNIRERDFWGETQTRRRAGLEVGRWHWVYTATVFRLDQRCRTAAERPVITDRGYVATREGLECFRRQLYAEALQRGLQQAENVLILGDGAAWIWNLAADTFGTATQRLDQYHANQHLWEIAAELYGKGTQEAKDWVKPYLEWIDQRKDGVLDVIRGLEELKSKLQAILDDKQRKALEREIGYMNEHKGRMDYKMAKDLGQPAGSGAIESTCSQYQRRFKLTGQFWSIEGDEAFIALATLHRNHRWHLLFPHDSDDS